VNRYLLLKMYYASSGSVSIDKNHISLVANPNLALEYVIK